MRGMIRRRLILALLATLPMLSLAMVATPTLVRAGGGCHAGADGSTYMEGDGTTVVRMNACSFAPTVSRVAAGTTVRFLNTANIQHQVLGRSATWGSVLLDPGQEHSETFAAAGVYPYTCPLHPGMVGAIVVGDGVTAVASDQGADPVGETATPPNETAQDTTSAVDMTGLAVVGLAGLGLGLGLGVLGMRSRARTTD
jgi:plastocyanin